MKKIGLIGEDPNDTSSIKNLLSVKYGKKCTFKPLLKQIRGHQLDNSGFNRKLRAEIKASKPAITHFIYIRDLDALQSTKGAVKTKKDWFYNLNKEFGNGASLLNIYELEALMLSDIKAFNKMFKIEVPFKGNPMMREKPKEFLMHHTKHSTKQYSESDAPKIFAELSFDTLNSKCAYFKEFISDFEKLIS